MMQFFFPTDRIIVKLEEDRRMYMELLQLISSKYLKLLSIILSGPTSTEVARIKAPSSIRAQFGTDCTRNACHGSDSHESARLVTDYFDSDVEI